MHNALNVRVAIAVETQRRRALAGFVGVGAGRGFTCNVAWQQEGEGDAEYLHACRGALCDAVASLVTNDHGIAMNDSILRLSSLGCCTSSRAVLCSTTA